MAARRQGTPLWVTIGCGCLFLIALVVGAFLVAGYFGVSAFKGYIEDMKDPASRNARAGEMLGISEFPEGYTAQLFVRVPWVFDMVILSDGDPAAVTDDNLDLDADSFGEHVFFFLTLRKGKMGEEEVEKMLRGDPIAEGVRVDFGLRADSAEELARGSFETPPQRLSYVSHRGEVEFENRPLSGIYTRVLVDCAEDELSRLGIWFQRRGEDDEALPVAGSPADENALRSFLGHFNLCVG